MREKRCIMYRKLLVMAFILSGVLSTSCSMFKSKTHVSHPDPNGSTDEKIAYHKSEVRKHQAAMEKEQHTSVRSLQQRNMSEVRRSNTKKERHARKITEHEQAIKDLEKEKGNKS